MSLRNGELGQGAQQKAVLLRPDDGSSQMGAALEFQFLSVQNKDSANNWGFKEQTPGPGERWQSAVSHGSGVEREMAMSAQILFGRHLSGCV